MCNTKKMLSFKFPLFFGFLLCVINWGCGSETGLQDQTNTTKEKVDKDDYVEFSRYRIADKTGFQSPVEAYSFLLPPDWETESDVIWIPPNMDCAGNYFYIKSSSKDGAYSFEILPALTWTYSTNKQFEQNYLNAGPRENCYYAPPLTAAAYLEQVFIPKYLSGAKILESELIKDMDKALAAQNQKTIQEFASYGYGMRFKPDGIIAHVSLDDKHDAVVQIMMNNSETTVYNSYTGTYDINYNSNVIAHMFLKYPKGLKEKASRILVVIMNSMRTNPNWLNAVNQFWAEARANSQRAHIGRLRAIEDGTKQILARGQQRMQDMDNQMRSWEAGQLSQERQHKRFVNTIREVDNFKDESGTYELSSGFNHAWSKGDGSTFILTDNPNFDPSSVYQDQQWKEMKKVKD